MSARLTSEGVVFLPSGGDQPVSITAGVTTSALFTIDTAATPGIRAAPVHPRCVSVVRHDPRPIFDRPRASTLLGE